MMLRIWFSIQKFGKNRTVYLKEKEDIDISDLEFE